ncbi:MAG TPA: hypothetical protein VIL65_11755 [Beijerinckiaceae bacterium]|jgi:hypothetical protein
MTTPLKGYRTLLLNAAAALVGVAQSFDWVDALGSRPAGYVVLALSLANMALRALTTTPLGDAGPPPDLEARSRP